MLSKSPPIPVPAEPNSQPVELTNGEAETEANPEAVDLDEAPVQRVVEEVREVRVNAGAGGLRVSFSAGVRFERRVAGGNEPRPGATSTQALVQPTVNDRWLTYAAIGLTIAIVALLMKKFLKSNGTVGYGDGL